MVLMCIPLNVVWWFDMRVRDFHLNYVNDFSSSCKNCVDPNPREESAGSFIKPSRFPLVRLVNTQGSDVVRYILGYLGDA